MEKVLGMVGKGVVKNGVMTFVDASGKGFAKHVSKPAVAPVVRREPAVTYGVSMIKEESIDVPSFMKNRKPAPVETIIEEPADKVVYLNNGYKGESKRTLRSDAKKVWNWLWDLED
jgi:hypothetical protein